MPLAKPKRKYVRRQKAVEDPSSALIKMFEDGNDKNQLLTTGMELFLTKDSQTISVHTADSGCVNAISDNQGIVIQGFSPEEIKQEQTDDKDLIFILNWLQLGLSLSL